MSSPTLPNKRGYGPWISGWWKMCLTRTNMIAHIMLPSVLLRVFKILIETIKLIYATTMIIFVCEIGWVRGIIRHNRFGRKTVILHGTYFHRISESRIPFFLRWLLQRQHCNWHLWIWHSNLRNNEENEEHNSDYLQSSSDIVISFSTAIAGTIVLQNSLWEIWPPACTRYQE